MSGRLHFCSSAFPRSCSDIAAFCCTIFLFGRTTRSNGHSYNFLFCINFSKIPRDPIYRGLKIIIIIIISERYVVRRPPLRSHLSLCVFVCLFVCLSVALWVNRWLYVESINATTKRENIRNRFFHWTCYVKMTEMNKRGMQNHDFRPMFRFIS